MVDKGTDKRWPRSYARSTMKTDRRSRDILGIIKKTYASLEKRGREREQARTENLEARVVGALRRGGGGLRASARGRPSGGVPGPSGGCGLGWARRRALPGLGVGLELFLFF